MATVRSFSCFVGGCESGGLDRGGICGRVSSETQHAGWMQVHSLVSRGALACLIPHTASYLTVDRCVPLAVDAARLAVRRRSNLSTRRIFLACFRILFSVRSCFVSSLTELPGPEKYRPPTSTACMSCLVTHSWGAAPSTSFSSSRARGS